MITLPDIAAIFGNLHEIHEMHSRFRKDLEPIVAKWTQHSEVGVLFKEMVNIEQFVVCVWLGFLLTPFCDSYSVYNRDCSFINIRS